MEGWPGTWISTGWAVTVVASESSFDVVSKVDKQEVDNAVKQTAKEISQRYDFKNTGADIDWTGDSILLKANAESRVLAVLDVFQTKLIKRGVSLKAIETGDPKLSGKEYRIEATLKDGLSQENAKKVGKIIREQGPKGVKTQITGDEMRVTSKSRDDLQEIIALLNAADLDFAVQFINYR
jgi:cyclic-di-GMP-binding protein